MTQEQFVGVFNKSNQPFHIALFVALFFHLLIILSVSIGSQDKRTSQHTLDITLVPFTSKKAPKKADYLAQANQQGSGTLKEKSLLTTTDLSQFHDQIIKEVKPFELPASKSPATALQLVTSIKSKTKTTTTVTDETHEKLETMNESDSGDVMQQSLDIASLEAHLRERKQAYAKRPRKRQLTTISAKSAYDAAYLDAWRIKIETVGNKDYNNLGIRGLYGSARILVAVNSDGTIERLKILKSSGYKALDDAALRVVHMAAPFQPFTPEIKENTDILEIIRTWKFSKGNYFSSE